MTLRRPGLAFFILSAGAAAFLYASFFFNFATTLSDFSGFGFTWTHQMFFNFLHGRVLQSSLFATLDAGNSVGFTSNPYAFIHSYVIHVNFTPYLFAVLWALHPTPATIYGLIFAWNLCAGGLMARSILRRAAPPEERERLFLALGVLAFGGLIVVLSAMAQFLLFAGPLILGAYDAFLARRRGAFLVWIAALALVGEDAAMVAACFGAYLFVFEEDGRSYGVVAASLSISYLLILLVVVQPAARAELTLSGATTTAIVLRKMSSLSGGNLAANLNSMRPLAVFVPAFALAAGLFGVPDRRGLVRAVGLALIPALPHWGECVVVGGAHHLLPPWYGLFLALLSWLRDARVPAPRAARWTAVSAAVFFAAALRVQAVDLPLRVRPVLLRLAGRASMASSIDRSLSVAESSNRALIAAAEMVPSDRSLVFLADYRTAGFIVGRSEVWDFPAFYDRADFLLVQKDAVDANFVFVPRSGVPLDDVISQTGRSQERDQAVTTEMVEALRSRLVGGGTHLIAMENEHVILFERRQSLPFENPPTTRGWGWIANIGRRRKS